MRVVSRSLTIKQMATVSGLAVIVISIFIVIQLFHFVQQRRMDYATQMENIAHTVRKPLSEAVLKADIPQAERILASLKPAGILSRADVVLPNAFQALRSDFASEKAVPRLVARLFELPVQITVPLYSVDPPNPKPLAYLVLQADSWRVYQFILSALATMVTTYLLLALILSVAIGWCLNRLMVHPLRKIARELQALPTHAVAGHQLPMPPLHRDDELGMLVRSYNRNQQVLARLHADYGRQATHYPLSELPNRTLFLALLEQYLAGSSALAPFSVLVIRIDTLHDGGMMNDVQRDALLLTLVGRLRGTLDASTVLAQLNDTDFAVLARRAGTPFRAMQLARALQHLLSQPLPLEGIRLRPRASIGIAQRDGQSLSAEALLRRAISAMMSARHHNAQPILFFDPQLTERAQNRLNIEHSILTALEQEQFVLFLQPQTDMRDGALVGAEALLRMRLADGSYGLPDEFITNAEETSMMGELGRWVLEESCRLLAGWQARGITLPLSVNLSALQLRDTGMVGHLRELLQRHRIRPGQLILELTETAQVGEPQQALALLQEICDAGVAIALDDFGMGYANLHCLSQFKSLPISKLKMDRSFVAALPEDDSMVRIVAAIGHITGLSVIAEGVESAEQRDWLLARGITLAQGYFYAQPLSWQAFNLRYFPTRSDEEPA
ncbi:biofilm formation regulator HmsP [Pantoea sp. 1.19]|uniref:biofilm formation regulator HmsP n=1 Tax=Pantoea sp. 1.19 TaxID=1925589 RepID=UPI000948B4F4|nr:biofilm formation regulator HmsP [Pantoea sp. 1.19]